MSTTVYAAKDNAPIEVTALPGVAVLVTVPAAFSGTCTSVCVPSILQNLEKIKKAGADRIIVISSDPPFSIQEWIKIAKFDNPDIEFASDFGNFEMRKLVGKLGDEEGKENLAPALGDLLRRSYTVVKEGEIVWQFIEPDTTKYTLKPEKLIEAVKKASGN